MVGWRIMNVSVKVLITHEQFIHSELMDSKCAFVCFFTTVYGLHIVETRKPLWSSLSRLAATISTAPWLILGDFNVVLSSHDIINGADISRYETRDFESFLFNTRGE